MKNNKGVIVAIIILSLLLVVISGYLVYDKVFIEKEASNKTSEEDADRTIANNVGIEIYNVGKGFRTLEDAAMTVTAGDIQYDLDNDGKKEYIVVLTDENYIFKGVSIDGKEILFKEIPGESLQKLYIVDLNKNDEILNIVVELSGMGIDTYYYLFDYQTNTVEEKNRISAGAGYQGNSIFVDGNGKIVPLSYIENATIPKFSISYLEYDGSINVKNVNLSDIFDKEFVIEKSDDYYYTLEKDFNKAIEKVHSGHTLEESGIYKFEKDTKIKIVKFNVDGENVVEAKLEDGRTIYIFPISGYLAG